MTLTRFSFNEITLIGTISKISPVVLSEAKALRIEFDLVTNDRFKTDANQWKEIPHYHHCNVVGKKAEQFKAFVKVGSYLWARGSVKSQAIASGNAPQSSRIQIREWSILSQADIDQIQGSSINASVKEQS